MNKPVTAEDIMRQNRREVASQATSIEQSRAIAEVQAAVTIAQKCPRNEPLALERALSVCNMWEVAETAFYKYKRGDGTVSDASINLAVELARCWGNISYGIMELDRDDERRMSEMLAFAWDMETNAQTRMSFMVPHLRDTKQGAKALVDLRDIYENNANMGARRVRECIFRVLPAYLKEQAKQACHDVLKRGQGNQPLQVRIVDAIAAFEEKGISRTRLEAKLGPSAKWTPTDVANLAVSFRSIDRQEVAADEEFPRVGVQETVDAARRIANLNASSSEGAKVNMAADGEPETGRSDEQHGDQHDGTEAAEDDGVHPAQRVADEIIAGAKASPDIHHLSQMRALRSEDIAAMPDEIALTVVRALNEAEERLGVKAQ